MRERVGAFVLGAAGLFGASELLSNPKNEGVEKPFVTASAPPDTVRGASIEELPPLFETETVEGENSEDLDVAPVESAQSLEKSYDDLKKQLKEQFRRCREMPDGMDPLVFYKTLELDDTFMYTDDDGNLILERLVSQADENNLAKTEKILGINVTENDDGSQEYTYTSGISFTDARTGENKSLFMLSDIDPSPEQIGLNLGRYLEAEGLYRSINEPLRENASTEEKIVQLNRQAGLAKGFIEYCDARDESGNPHLFLDAEARSYLLELIQKNRQRVNSIREQG